MLHLAVELPLSQAYDRIPTRFKGWFFGRRTSGSARNSSSSRSAALRERSSNELAELYVKLETLAKPFEHRKRPWDEELVLFEVALENSRGRSIRLGQCTPFSIRSVLALPVEDVTRLTPGEGKIRLADWS